MALPKLSAQQPIAVAGGRASPPFLEFLEKTREAQTATDERQDEVDEALQQQADGLADAVLAIQEALGLIQVAQATGNAAQAAADEATGAGTTSGSATDPAIDVVDETWVHGPQVDLAGVVAGDLTITGSGPKQDDDVSISGGATFLGECRIVEIVGGVDEELVVTPEFRVSAVGTVSAGGSYAEAVAAFSEARASTGAISYRIDTRRSAGSAEVTNLSLYLFVRRAA